MLDTKDPENDNLEEELERIIMLADNISESALSAAENSAGNAWNKKQKGVKKSKRSSTAAFVLRTNYKNLRSCSDKSIRLQTQPRLSPLAARAALAAAVTPLRQASQSNLSDKSHPHSTCKAGTSSINTSENDSRKNGKSTRTSVRRSQRLSSASSKIQGSTVKGAGSLLRDQRDPSVQLVVDIPIDRT